MEEDIDKTEKKYNPSEKLVINRLKNVIEIAEQRTKYEAAHDPELTGALNTVRDFIIRKRRVCYGGTAMNAILPKEKHFYNPEIDLPDYDFFTPDITNDIAELIKDLKNKNFKDVYHRVGIHEGTHKILVNFVAIADITYISEEVFNTFLKRAIKRDNMYYTDPDILRMMMYLEISRPKGQVERWEKVYERLQLINSSFPPKSRSEKQLTRKVKSSNKVQREILDGIYNYCIENQRVIISGRLDSYYKNVVHHSTPIFNLHDNFDVIGFISADVKMDSKILQKQLGGSEKCKLYLHQARGEFLPEHVEVRYNDVPVAFLLEEAGCHAYLNFPLKDGRSIAIASLDTLITIYYSISIFTKRLKQLIPGINYKIVQFIKLTEENRRHKDPAIPAFPLSCHGYQKGFSTLLREKTFRIKKARDKIKVI